MKLFVTGGTGFVGTHFLEHALAAGHEIVALRRPGSATRLPLAREPAWIEGALDSDVSAHLKGVDVLVHLASHTPNPPYAPLDECLYWNVYAALKLARQALAGGVRDYLIAGSCFEYGRAAERYDAIPTDAPLEPTLSYPTSKAAASVAFEGFTREQGVRLKLLRIFQVYGEGEQASRMWPSMRRAALAGRDFPMSYGEQVRDFVPVEDVAKAFVRALDLSTTRDGEPMVEHVASGQPCRLLEFARHWWARWNASGRLLPGAVPYRPNELMRLVPQMLHTPGGLHEA